jgi:hypothetical protein
MNIRLIVRSPFAFQKSKSGRSENSIFWKPVRQGCRDSTRDFKTRLSRVDVFAQREHVDPFPAVQSPFRGSLGIRELRGKTLQRNRSVDELLSRLDVRRNCSAGARSPVTKDSPSIVSPSSTNWEWHETLHLSFIFSRKIITFESRDLEESKRHLRRTYLLCVARPCTMAIDLHQWWWY